MRRLVLCFDAGSEGGRVLLIDDAGNHVAAARCSWPVSECDGSLARSLDTDSMWRAFASMTRQVVSSAGIRGDDIAALSVTSQRQSVVFLGPGDEVLYAAPNNDLRAVFEGAAMAEACGDLLYRVTGHAPPFLFASARLRWLANHEPERHARLRRLLMLADWLIYRLTGEAATEPTLAAESGLLDVEHLCWSTEVLEALAIDERLLPPIVAAGSVVGPLLPAVADELALRVGIPVVAAGADTQCALLGMGVIAPGDLGAVLGWSGPVQIVLDRPRRDVAKRVWTTCHAVPNRWLLESTMGETGNAYRWLRDTLVPDEGEEGDCPAGYQRMDNLAAQVEPGAGGVLAFLGPGIMDMGALRMPLGGFLFSLPVSFSGVDQRSLIRASLENVAYAAKGNVLQLAELADTQGHSLAVGGGMACSDVLMQILADVLDMPVRTSCATNVTALGSAMCGAVGGGLYQSLWQAVQGMARPGPLFTPRPEYAGEYQDHYQRWLKAYHHLQELNGELS